MEDRIEGVSELETLETARLLSGLGRFEMWVRYFSMGGQASPLELDAFFNDSLIFPDSEYNIVVHALNERLEEAGLSRLLPLRPVVRPEGWYESARSVSKSVLERSIRIQSEAIEMRISTLDMRSWAQEMRRQTRELSGKLERQRAGFATQGRNLGIQFH
jgi:hypothetical protein